MSSVAFDSGYQIGNQISAALQNVVNLGPRAINAFVGSDNMIPDSDVL